MSDAEKVVSAEALERVRRACMALPEATEKVARGEPTWRVRDRLFVMFADNHHKDGRIAAWCAAPLGVQEMVLRAEPEKYFAPPYVGVKGWIGVVVGRVSDRELAGIAVQAYAVVAPKKLLALLDRREARGSP
jgi:hypothetical protein